MGGARNLKLKGNGSKGQGTGDNNFFARWPNVNLIHLLCASKRYSEPLVMPPEAEMLSFWTCNESRKFACCLIFQNAKNSQISVLSCKNSV